MSDTPMTKVWICEWRGMTAEFEALSRAKARYRAFKLLNEWWSGVRLIDIKMRRRDLK
jgi:hypothetical protein